MADIQRKVLTTPTFINGSLHPAGAIVSVDMDQFKPTGESAGEGSTSNLADVGQAAVLVPAEIAAIGPTGPAPRAPQQKPAGTLETAEGFTNGGALLVAEGHPEAREMIEGARKLNEGVEEEAVQRLNDTAQAAGTAGSGTNGTESGNSPTGDEGEPFTGDNEPVGDTDKPALSGMNKAQLLKQAKAEGVTDVTEDNNKAEITARIEEARAKA